MQQRISDILEINKGKHFQKENEENEQDYKANLKILK